MDYFQAWLDRKRSTQFWYVAQTDQITYTHHRAIGPRSIHGGITLAVQPATYFSFHSTVQWPQDNYEQYALDGLLETLLTYDIHPIFGCEWRLQKIEWHDVNSAGVGYYAAAKEASKQLLRLSTREPNVTRVITPNLERQ